MNKVNHLENYSRPSNIRIIGLREACEGTDPIDFSTTIIPSLQGKEHLEEPLVIKREHRSLALHPSPDQNPQPFLVRFLRYQDREKVFRTVAKHFKEKGVILYNGEAIKLFPDMSPGIIKHRKEFDQVKK